MSSIAALLFGLRSRVGRRPYILWGFALAAMKFLIDTGIVYGFTKKTWSPLGYLVPSLVLRDNDLGSVPGMMHLLLAVTAMPFLWIGITMSVRRAADAGVSPWVGVGFLVPIFNYLTIALLAILPSKDTARWEPAAMSAYRRAPGDAAPPPSGVDLPSGVRAALLGVSACIGVGMSMLWFAVYGLGAYGVALFFATPFTMGAVSATIYNAKYPRSVWSTLGLALLGTVMTGSVVMLFALEGFICLVMAFPIAAALSMVGALLAWTISTSARRVGNTRNPAAMLLLLPAFAVGESKLAEPTLRHVTTSIDIDAPPERVWPNVVGFSDLPAPPRWLYRLGVAYPLRARIQGSGVGAVRHCEFSTGPFVEPITVWDEPRRLAFDVTSQPPSMTEWSPYQSVKAPHLEGYMVSKGGEFRLVPLPGGRTRLEGTTHYTLAIYPELYWVMYGEVLLHGIHGRVLEHIKHLSEN